MVMLYALVLGYVTAKIFSGPHEHTRGLFKSIILYYRDLKFHVHHWIMGLFAVTLYFVMKVIVLGYTLNIADFAIIYFIIGVIIQGIIDYKDWTKIIES